jgi:hypothetical protein
MLFDKALEPTRRQPSRSTNTPRETMPLSRLAITPERNSRDILVRPPHTTPFDHGTMTRLRHVLREPVEIRAMRARLHRLDLHLSLTGTPSVAQPLRKPRRITPSPTQVRGAFPRLSGLPQRVVRARPSDGTTGIARRVPHPSKEFLGAGTAPKGYRALGGPAPVHPCESWRGV